MPRRHTVTRPAPDPEISRLKAELSNARETIIDLMPADIRERLHSYTECTTSAQGQRWISDTFRWLADRAPPVPDPHWGEEERGYCPLCGSGGFRPYDRGYQLPTGLAQHFRGYNNAYPCPVMHEVLALARTYWQPIFEAAERQQAAHQAERRQTETVYRFAPGAEPRLPDDVVNSSATPRTAADLLWAEDRLKALGFKRTTDGNCVAWVDERKDCRVYANPLAAGRIDFTVFPKPFPKDSAQHANRPPNSFYLLDRYHIKLEQKYAKRVAEALADRAPS